MDSFARGQENSLVGSVNPHIYECTDSAVDQCQRSLNEETMESLLGLQYIS